MSENEKRLRDWMLTHAGHAALTHLDVLLAEHRAEVERLEAIAAERFRLAEQQEGRAARAEAALSSARDAALEEAALWLQGVHSPPCYERPVPEGTTVGECGNCARARGVRALKSRPAEVVPVEKVREVLREAHSDVHDDAPAEYIAGWDSALTAVRNGLGIDLDATPGEANDRDTTRPICVACGGSHKFSAPCKASP